MISTPQRAALLALAEKGGGSLTPEAVVSAARDPASPLHTAFEWDDAKAAMEHRLSQARHMIRRVMVFVETPQALIKTPYFVRTPAADPKEQGYVTLPRLRTDEEMAREAVLVAFSRASRALQEARSLAAAVGIPEEAVADIGDRIGALSQSVASREAHRTAGSA